MLNLKYVFFSILVLYKIAKKYVIIRTILKNVKIVFLEFSKNNLTVTYFNEF